jgi:hypothetical protein
LQIFFFLPNLLLQIFLSSKSLWKNPWESSTLLWSLGSRKSVFLGQNFWVGDVGVGQK